MKSDLTELVFILDRSGSMQKLTQDTIGGFNAMVEKQKKEPGEAFVTTILFDSQYDILYDHLPLQDIMPIIDKEYFARGTTAFLDAVGITINTVGARLKNTPEDERPGKVIFVNTTDGLENASHDFARNYEAGGAGTRNLYEGVGAMMACMRMPEFDHKKKDGLYKKVV